MDPTLAYTVPSWLLLDVVCTRLMNHPDKAGTDGLQLVPEAAVKPRSVEGRAHGDVHSEGPSLQRPEADPRERVRPRDRTYTHPWAATGRPTRFPG